MFRVLENGKDAVMEVEGWTQNIFCEKRDAEVYAFHWCYPITYLEARYNAPEMELGKDYDYSFCEFPVLMRIEEI